MPAAIAYPTELTADEQRAVRVLAETIEERDGEPPLSDQALTQLASSQVRHTLLLDADAIAGYAQYADGTGEIATDSDGVDVLLAAVRRIAEPEHRVWSHGMRSPVVGALERSGYTRIRILHQLRRPLGGELPEVMLPAQVTIRPFVLGHDETAWLAVNAAAFAEHAEQGRWTAADLAAREAESWFDPDGFLLAWRGGDLLGYHWTKVHGDGTGEVYVLGISPAAQGMRLGGALLAAGMRWLAGRGCPEVMLYVDESNPSAMRLYERFGFTRHDIDVQWSSAD